MQLPPDDGSVKRVLDIGCGPGNSTAVLRERYPHAEILGVDSSQDMVEAARNTYPDIDFQLCDVSTQLNDSTWCSPMPASSGCRIIRI